MNTGFQRQREHDTQVNLLLIEKNNFVAISNKFAHFFFRLSQALGLFLLVDDPENRDVGL